MKLALNSALGALAAALLSAHPAAAVTALYPDVYADLPPSLSDGKPFLGAPDDDAIGLGRDYVTYDLEDYRLVDGAGQDFNVYEVDSGVVEFNLIDILVSADNIHFFNVESTAAAALNLDGDEAHGAGSFRRSYNVTGAVAALGVSSFRYIRIDGTGSGAAGGNNGFDLDAIGVANSVSVAPATVPEPSAWALMILGFGGAGRELRRKARATGGLNRT